MIINENTLQKIDTLIEETPHMGDNPTERTHRKDKIKYFKRLRDHERKNPSTDSVGKQDASAGDHYQAQAIKTSARGTLQEKLNKKDAKNWFPSGPKSARGTY